jgi:hypothetical protein
MAAPEPSKHAVSPILVGTVFAYLLALGLYFRFHDEAPQPLEFSHDALQNVSRTMAPLIAISAFLERAVEIVIATTRGPRSLELRRALDAAGPKTKDAARWALDRYQLETQRFSFAVSLALSLAATLCGVRAVAPLLAPSPVQLRWFDLFDAGLTSLLLAGGSDGIHQVVTTITSFLESSRNASEERGRRTAALPPAGEHHGDEGRREEKQDEERREEKQEERKQE